MDVMAESKYPDFTTLPDLRTLRTTQSASAADYPNPCKPPVGPAWGAVFIILSWFDNPQLIAVQTWCFFSFQVETKNPSWMYTICTAVIFDGSVHRCRGKTFGSSQWLVRLLPFTPWCTDLQTWTHILLMYEEVLSSSLRRCCVTKNIGIHLFHSTLSSTLYWFLDGAYTVVVAEKLAVILPDTCCVLRVFHLWISDNFFEWLLKNNLCAQ